MIFEFLISTRFNVIIKFNLTRIGGRNVVSLPNIVNSIEM